MAERFGGAAVVTALDPSADEIDAVVKAAVSGQYDDIVVGTYNGDFYRGQIDLANRLSATGKDVTVVSLRNPYDLKLVDKRAVKYAAYEYTENALLSVAAVLSGKAAPTGRMSVTL
jgi:hypothetical protein